MNILDPCQFEILRRVRAGHYLSHLPAADLQSEIELMLALRLIEPTGACPYRLTTVGAKILSIAEREPSERPLPSTPPPPTVDPT